MKTSSSLIKSLNTKQSFMSVVGIDFGNLNTVVAVARNRGIDVITNEVSNRATPSLVSFGERQRFLGEAAKTQEISNFKNTASNLKRLLGLNHADKDIDQIEKTYSTTNLVCGKNDLVAASVMFRNEQQEFTFTEIAAMFMTKVKEFTQNEIKIPVTDCVISVPQWFTDHQRRAVFDAAEIAQLNCLRVLTDTTAIALGYGITKVDLPDLVADPTLKPKNIVFVDLGHSSYQVAIVSFVKGKLQVKGTACDRHLGGRDFDEVLTQHYIKEFSAKYKIDIASNKKAIFRLRQGCERVKKILSANLIAMLNVECLMEEKDVSAQVNRADYEEMIKPLIERLTGPLVEALSASGLDLTEIDAVEIVGGSTRIPQVKEKLVEFFGDKLQTTLNQDEAVARGCALQCAVLSPVLKVRDFTTQDWNGFPIQFSWDKSLIALTKEGAVADHVIEAFPLGNVVPSAKNLTLIRKMDEAELAANKSGLELKISADYSESIYQRCASTGNGTHIANWLIKGIKHHAPAAGDIPSGNGVENKATIRIKTRLDGNNIVHIDSAQLLIDVVVPVLEEKKVEKKDVKVDTKVEVESPVEPEITEEKTRKIVRKYELVVVPELVGCTKTELVACQAAEAEMNATDRLVIDTADKRNALEEYVYETRSKLEMAWSDFADEAGREKFMNALTEMEGWLYTEEGEEATKSMFIEKAEILRRIGDPIAFRAREFESRIYSEKAFKDYANSILISLSAGDDKYSHIAESDIVKCTQECTQKLDWLNASIAKQNDISKSAPLVITSDEINRAKQTLFGMVNPILSKPKPAPIVEVPVAEEKKDEEMAPAAEELVTPETETMELD